MDPIYNAGDQQFINKRVNQSENQAAQQDMSQNLTNQTYREEQYEDYTVIETRNASARRQRTEINQNRLDIRTRKQVLTELADERNQKKFGDSALMKNIKSAAVDIEDLLELSVPLNQEKLDKSISALEMRLDVLISFCNEYVKKNDGKTKGVAGARLGFVKELKTVTELEKANIRLAAMAVKAEHQNESELTNWSEIIIRARSEEVDGEDPNYKFLDKQAITDSGVALSRIAEYMGAGDVFLKRDYVNVKGKVRLRSRKMDTENYKSLTELATKEPEAIKRYSVTAFKKLQAVQAVEELLGLRFNASDIYVKYKAITEKANDKDIRYAVIEDLIVRTPGHIKLVRDMPKESKNAGVIMDRGMANRIAAMNPEAMSLLLAELIDSKQRKKLVKNIRSMQERLHTKDTRILGENDWINDGEALLANIRKAAGEGEKARFDTEAMYRGCASTLDYGELRHTRISSDVQEEDPKEKQQINESIMNWYKGLEKKSSKEMTAEAKKAEQERQKKKRDACLKRCGQSDKIILQTAEMMFNINYESPNGKPEFGWRDRSNEPVFAKVPSPEDIKQGTVGDCYLLAALSALARNEPQTIMKMIVDMGDYAIVKFPSKDEKHKIPPIPVSKRTVTLKLPGEATIDYYSQGALWVALIEKAYGQLHYEHNKYDGGNLRLLSDEYRRKNGSYGSSEDDRHCLHPDLKYSVEITAGGHVHDALSNLTGQKYVNKDFLPTTVDTMDEVYTNMWNKAESGDEQMGINGFNDEERYLRGVLEESLKKELVRRYSRTYKNYKGKITTNAYRNISIENIRETLLDIRNWTYENGDKDYVRLYKNVKEKFHPEDATFSETKFMTMLVSMADRLETTNDNLNQCFEHETVGDNVRYSKHARNMAEFLKEALKHGILTTGTSRFIKSDGKGLNSEHVVEGMVEGHAYTIVDCNEIKETGKIMLSMRNPWGKGGMEYTKTTDANGNVITIGRQSKPEAGDDGSFEIELNDFLRFFNTVAAAENVLAMPQVLKRYNRI